MITVVVTGDKRLNRKLQRLKATDAKKAVRESARIALKDIAFAARQNAPVDSGKLQRSIKVRSLKRSRSKVGARVTTGTQTTDFSGETYYGAFLEYGTEKQEALGYMKSAADNNKQHALRVYRRELKKRIESAAKRG